ncbi:hypothetical protein ACJX0J_023954 [Zea mays]
MRGLNETANSLDFIEGIILSSYLQTYSIELQILRILSSYLQILSSYIISSYSYNIQKQLISCSAHERTKLIIEDLGDECIAVAANTEMDEIPPDTVSKKLSTHYLAAENASLEECALRELLLLSPFLHTYLLPIYILFIVCAHVFRKPKIVSFSEVNFLRAKTDYYVCLYHCFSDNYIILVRPISLNMLFGAAFIAYNLHAPITICKKSKEDNAALSEFAFINFYTSCTRRTPNMHDISLIFCQHFLIHLINLTMHLEYIYHGQHESWVLDHFLIILEARYLDALLFLDFSDYNMSTCDI